MIKKLDINLFGHKEDRELFKKAHNEYIVEKVNNGLSQKAAELSWKTEYPNFITWMTRKNIRYLNTLGQQENIDKINELIDAINQIQKPSNDLEEELNKML